MTEVDKLLAMIDDSSYTHLIFDLDATLTLLDLPWDKWVELVAKYLPAAQAESFREINTRPGLSWSTFTNQYVETYDGFLDALIAGSEEFESTYFAHTPYDELTQSIHGLAGRDKILSVWSANTRPTVERALLELGIQHYFDRVVTRNDVRLAKPDPEGWRLLDDGTPKPEYLFVGDSSNDENAAKAIGLDYYEVSFFHSRIH